jgi:hypothetical protein
MIFWKWQLPIVLGTMKLLWRLAVANPTWSRHCILKAGNRQPSSGCKICPMGGQLPALLEVQSTCYLDWWSLVPLEVQSTCYLDWWSLVPLEVQSTCYLDWWSLVPLEVQSILIGVAVATSTWSKEHDIWVGGRQPFVKCTIYYLGWLKGRSQFQTIT